jgi:hypothetical protein
MRRVDVGMETETGMLMVKERRERSRMGLIWELCVIISSEPGAQMMALK